MRINHENPSTSIFAPLLAAYVYAASVSPRVCACVRVTGARVTRTFAPHRRNGQRGVDSATAPLSVCEEYK